MRVTFCSRGARKANELRRMSCRALEPGFWVTSAPSERGRVTATSRATRAQEVLWHMWCLVINAFNAIHAQQRCNCLAINAFKCLCKAWFRCTSHAPLPWKAAGRFPRSGGVKSGRACYLPRCATWFRARPPPALACCFPRSPAVWCATCWSLVLPHSEESYFWNFDANGAIFEINVAPEGQIKKKIRSENLSHRETFDTGRWGSENPIHSVCVILS